MTLKGLLRSLATLSLSQGERVVQSNPRAKLPYGTQGRVFWRKGSRVGIITPDGRKVWTTASNLSPW